MASEERPDGHSVIGPEQVAAEASKFGFYHAVATLERLHPDAPQPGGLGPVAEEVIRFRHDPSLTFSSSDVAHIVIRKKRDPNNQLAPPRTQFEITTTFLGLTGAVTPLPVYIAEEIAHEDPDSPAQREFLDIFHHRILGLLYRVRTKYNIATEFRSTVDDPWSHRILTLAGLDTYEQAPPPKLPKWRLMRLAPLLANRARTCRTLEVALEDVLEDVLEGARVQIEQFVGRWVDIEQRQLMKLGAVNTRLGEDSVMGIKIFDRGGKFRLVVGPLSGAAFRRFLPDGDQVPIVRDVVTLFARDQLEFDMELILAKDATPTLRLDMNDGSKLGLDSWLGSQTKEETRVVVEVPFNSEQDLSQNASSDGDGLGGDASDRPARSSGTNPGMRSNQPTPESIEGASSYR